MFEDSYLDSFMESHIGGWTGDEDRYYIDDADEAESYYEGSAHADAWDDLDDHDICGYEPEDDPYASEWRDDDDSCDHY